MEQQPTGTRPGPDSIARILAVLALLVGAIVVVVVIASSTGGSDGSEQGQGGQGAGQARESYCVVRPGDTFAAIAVQARVPETRLAELNPNLDQFSIQPENCVNLVPKGCKELSGGGPPNPCT